MVSTERAVEKESAETRVKAAMLLFLVLGTFGVLVLATYFLPREFSTEEYWARLSIVYVVALLQPIIAYSYYFYRRKLRWSDIDRIQSKLFSGSDKSVALQFKVYLDQYKQFSAGLYFFVAVGISWLVSAIGLSVYFLAPDILTADSDDSVKSVFPLPGSRGVIWFAVLGSHLWGLKFILRRYFLNDLIPGAFYSIAIRTVFAATVAFLVFSAYGSFADSSSLGATTVWPAIAFLIGTFPQSGLQWLTDRIPAFSRPPNPNVRIMPVSMIEGVDPPDEVRLEELGIDSCYDLAQADFFPIFIQSEFNARQIVDWILQAKLCIYFGESIVVLREHGIRTIVDLNDLKGNPEKLSTLARNSSASEDCLLRAQKVADSDEIKRLMLLGGMLGQFTPVDNDDGLSEPAEG